jgi:hypothetical protein
VALRLDPNRSSRHSRRPNQSVDLPFGGTGRGTHVLPAREGIALAATNSPDKSLVRESRRKAGENETQTVLDLEGQ